MRVVLIVGCLVVFGLASFVVARWLYTDNLERGAVTALLRDQAAGRAEAVIGALRCQESKCRAVAARNARTLRTRGLVEIVRYDSSTARTWGDEEGTVRVVWQAPGRLPTVQCVGVTRRGSAPGKTSVTLTALSAPIERQASCPGS